MDAAGLVVGIACLAGLFRTVPDVLEKVDSYRKFGAESRFTVARLNLDKAWAENVGPAGAALRAEHHLKLDDLEVSALVYRTLHCMKDRFGPIETAIKDLDVLELSDAARPLEEAEPYESRKLVLPLASRKTKLACAFTRKTRSLSQLNDFEWLFDEICRLVPPEGSKPGDSDSST